MLEGNRRIVPLHELPDYFRRVLDAVHPRDFATAALDVERVSNYQTDRNAVAQAL